LIAGVGLLVSELFLPGLITGFFGIGAIIVSFLRWLGIVSGLTQSFIAWLGISFVLLVTLRQVALKWFPSQRTFEITDEDISAAGTVVDVIQEIQPSGSNGRIRFAGTTWPAVSKEGVLPPGTKAKLLYRDNLIWVVEPFSEFENKISSAELEIEKPTKE
jgi:membrane protein implicated in regulation of membrane protease activity